MVVLRQLAMVALVCGALVGCAHATFDEARAAYLAGDLKKSATLLEAVQPANDADKRAIADLSRAVDNETKRVIDSLLADAGRARSRADAGSQGYSEAISYYQAALGMMNRDSDSKSVKTSLARAQEFQEKRVRTFRGTQKKLEAAVKCAGATQRETVFDMWSQRRACDNTESLVPVVLRLADLCAKAERYDDALRLRNVLDDSGLSEQARTGVNLDVWPADAQRWFAWVEVRAEERALRTASTTTAPTATFSPIAAANAAMAARDDATPRHRSGRRGDTPKQTAPQQPQTAAVSRADQVLTRAKRLYEDGAVFDALLAIDAAMSEELPDSDRAKLEAQEAAWAPERKRLIEEYLRRGENALREEQIESAYAWYQRILTLDPSHEVAQDRARRLDRLKSLRDH
jgi:tetratricopeptide (TPR) repeat protein